MKLIIVENSKWQTYQKLVDKFDDDLNVRVLLDRRRKQIRRSAAPRSPERRAAERRRLTKAWGGKDYVVINVVLDPEGNAAGR
jgi:hypothetical protein